MGTKKQILVVKLGWVLVGDVMEIAPDDPQKTALTVKDASVIRVWGTDKGLGQLAAHGPLPKTLLDPCGVVIVERDAILFRIDCEETAWPSKKKR